MTRNDVYRGELLDRGQAETLLYEAWIADAGAEVRVVGACLHRVLILEVELEVVVGYRGASTPATRRTLVGTFEPLRAQYEADLDSAQLAWQLGAPPDWLDERVSACLAAHDVRSARVVRWAEDDVAEIGFVASRKTGPDGHPIHFVGVNPVRDIGGEGAITQARLVSCLLGFMAPFFAWAVSVELGAPHDASLAILLGGYLVAGVAARITRPPRVGGRICAAMATVDGDAH